jgi:peptide/nickel transport system substrate-binding protein
MMCTLTRRSMLRAALATTATALLSACSSAGSTPSPTAPAAAGAQSTANGKTVPDFNVAVAVLPDFMDPHQSPGNVQMRIHYFVFDMLIKRDFLDGNKLVPWLASEWKRVNDTTLDVTIRKDVLWQDGTPFGVDDVVYTFKRLMTRDPKLEVASPAYFSFASVEAVDDSTVRFVTSLVDPALEKRLAGLGAWIIPAKYHQQVGADAFSRKPIGTGPYMLTEFVAGDHFTFAAHDHYFGGAPVAKKLTVKQIGETAARMAAALNGEVDLMTNLPPEQISTIQTKKELVVRQATLANLHTLQYDQKARPFEKIEIRQAVNAAIDRKTLVDTIWGGNAVHTRGYQYEGEELYNPNRPFTEYDLDKAKALLTRGGYAGEPITYLAATPNYYTNEAEVAQAVVDMWTKAGINARLELVELSQKGKAFTEDTRHANTGSSTSGIGDPDGYLFRSFGPTTAPQTSGQWPAASADQFNKIGQEARTTSDPKQRYELYQQMLDAFESEAPGTTLYAPKESYALKATFDWTPYPLYYMDLRSTNLRVK